MDTVELEILKQDLLNQLERMLSRVNEIEYRVEMVKETVAWMQKAVEHLSDGDKK